jgi:BirA family biotin operon repressor/biotin-[acetyl-CoA-carboxylase] ligase
VPRLLSLAAGIAVAEVAGPAAELKWPNDVLLDGRKLAGILVEGRPQESWAVLGIGVNVALDAEALPAELRGTVATLGGRPSDVADVLRAVLASAEHWLAAPDALVLSAVRERDALRGQVVRWSGGTGTAAGVDSDGRLRVETPDGLVALEAGEVHLGGP